MEGKWKILLVLIGLLFCFGLVYVIAGNGKQSSPEQIKKASMSNTEAVAKQKRGVALRGSFAELCRHAFVASQGKPDLLRRSRQIR